MNLEELHKEYSRIVEAIKNSELSQVNGQGALAYLELKARDAGIVFIAPELNHNAPTYVPLNETVQNAANSLFTHSDDSSGIEDYLGDSSDVYDDLSDVVTPTPPEKAETDSDLDSKFEQ